MSLHNGSENVASLVERIKNSLDPLNYQYEVFLVTKDSEDKEELDKIIDEYPVRFLVREKNEGASSAVLRCIEKTSHDTIVVMDSSLRHPPEKIPELVSELENGKDIAVGSQPQNNRNSYFRKISIKFVDIMAKTLFRDIREIKDIKSGFFAFEKNIIQNSHLNPIGYRILIEILIQGKYENVSEIEYETDESESKLMSIEHKLVNYLKHIWNLTHRTGELIRIIKFVFAGGIGAIINLLSLYLLTNFGNFHYLLSGLIAIEIGLVSSFFINKSWTFKDRNTEGIIFLVRSLVRDHLVRSGGMAINFIILGILTSLGLHYMLSQAIGIWFAGIWNFGGNKWWTWGSNN